MAKKPAPKPDPESGPARAPKDPGAQPERRSFPIVGVGASAGGLQAFTELLRALPADTGMGFVLVQHLSPSHPSALAEILSRSTTMPVIEVRGEVEVAPDYVYVIPPGQTLMIAGGVLELQARGTHTIHHPVDHFFRALAEDRGHEAIGVVLSGTATDGTIGLQAIKGEGGITFAQDSSAQHDGMPQSAIASGCVDLVLPPAEIARELTRIARQSTPDSGENSDTEPQFSRIVELLYRTGGIDFSGYKSTTLSRRIKRRMILRKVDSSSAYLKLLQSDPTELEALGHDFLINVTSFFRNPEAFEALKQRAFTELLKDRSPRDPVRIWSVGCSTGEEAYSLAIAYSEVAQAAGSEVPFQLFATDLGIQSMHKARAGVYSADIAQDVSPERLRRYFVEVNGGYRISKDIRDACVFSRHNVLTDPPFSRIDVLSCRNLLIYLEPALQQRIMPILHYALRPAGWLFLGGSETIGTHRRLFEAAEGKHRIYSRKAGPLPGGSLFALPHAGVRTGATPQGARPADRVADLPREADRILSGRFAPPGVLVSADLEILQFRGDTGRFLTPAPGRASLSLLKMLREGLPGPVRRLLAMAAESKVPIRQDGVRVRSVAGAIEVSLEAIPLPGKGDEKAGFLLLFEEQGGPGAGRRSTDAREISDPPAEGPGPEVARLEQELAASREYLQSVVEQAEAANEELQSANEEVQSANEELQSVNEELETSKEEIQSSNEELATVNDELNNRNSELHRLNADLSNLLGSIRTSIVMLGPDLRIRRFTAEAAKKFGMLPGDVGRPFRDIRLPFTEVLDVDALLTEVIDTVQAREIEVRDLQGCWYSLRLRPYRTPDHRIDGVVVMVIDIDTLKRSQQITASIVDTVREPVLVLDSDLRIKFASPSFYYRFHVSPGQTQGRRLHHLGDGQWDIPELRRMLEDVLVRDTVVRDYVVEHEFEHIGLKTMRLNARRVSHLDEAEPIILLAIEDDTERKSVREALHHFRSLFESAPGAYLVLAPEDYRIVGVSDAYLKATMTEREVITGRTVFEVFPDDPGSANSDGVRNLTASLARVKETRESDVMPPQFYPIPKPPSEGGGFEERWWSPVNSPVLGPDGELTYIIHRVEDITPYIMARREEGTLVEGMQLLETRAQQMEADILLRSHELRRANENLRQSTEQYRSLVNQIEDYAIFRTDPEGLATTWNEGVRRVLGFEESEFVGIDVAPVIFTPEDLEQGIPKREYHAAVLAGKVSSDRWMRRKDGTVFYSMGITISHHDSSGGLTGFTKVMRNQTDQKRLEEQLLERNMEMSEADRHKNEFLAMLAHELRNPLAPLVNAIRIIKMSDGDPGTVRGAIEMMERQTGQMVRLVDDLLDVNRISRGTIELRKAPVELTSVVAHAIEAIRPQCEDRSQHLSVSVPSEQIYVFGDPARLTQVVGNLLNNASKFSPDGGDVGLSVVREGEQVVLRVRDSGIGIPPDHIERIFEMFVQVDSTVGRLKGGIGMGLTLVRELVKLHGGTVEAESSGTGRGSEFTVRLPRLPAPPLSNEEPGRIDRGQEAASRRILVVDDNRDAADSLAAILQLHGHIAETAYDGLEAVGRAASFRPQLILLDLGLPSIDGYEVARRLREEEWGKDIEIVALTGWGAQADLEKSAAAGFRGHLVKPVRQHDLLQMLGG